METENQMSTKTAGPPDLETIRFDIDGEIGTMTLDRPDFYNAMSPEMIGELAIAFAWLADRAPLRALIITGSGKAFSSGGDITWFQTGINSDEHDLPSEVRRGAEVLHQGTIDMMRIPYPVIAAINGPAAGAGFSLALACDFRIASEDAFMACAYGRIGASPDGGMTYFLPRIVAPSRALEIMLDDLNLTAREALDQGLVSELVPADRLISRAHEKAQKLATMAPHYVRTAKMLIHASLDNSITEHLQLERHAIADSMATEDLREGVKVFFAGGKPEFHGR